MGSGWGPFQPTNQQYHMPQGPHVKGGLERWRGGENMDHVIDSLKNWLAIYKADEPKDIDYKAIECIEKALDELYKYYNI